MRTLDIIALLYAGAAMQALIVLTWEDIDDIDPLSVRIVLADLALAALWPLIWANRYPHSLRRRRRVAARRRTRLQEVDHD